MLLIDYISVDCVCYINLIIYRYFRQKLKEMGFVLYGSDHSPVIPMLLYHPGRVS